MVLLLYCIPDGLRPDRNKREETVCQYQESWRQERPSAFLPEMGERSNKPDEMKWGAIKVLRRKYAQGGLGPKRLLPQAKKVAAYPSAYRAIAELLKGEEDSFFGG